MDMDIVQAAIAGYITISKYAKYRPGDKRREVWGETVGRCKQMHADRFRGNALIEANLDSVFDMVERREVFGSMRSLQFAGRSAELNNARIYNCCFSYADRPRFFAEAFWLLLSGCGVGFSVQKHHVARLPPVAPQFVDREFVAMDSIEGWADVAYAVVKGAFEGVRYIPVLDNIRDEGAPIVTSGGKAPGPEPLRRALAAVWGVLYAARGRHLTPLECFRVCCLFSEAVLSGGIRRSAMIALFSPDDAEMLAAKTGDWWVKNPEYALCNISAIHLRHKLVLQDIDRIVRTAVDGSGEPGGLLTESLEYGTNPCIPDTAPLLTPTGVQPLSRVNIGDTIWSGQRWTRITNKWKTGEKEVVRYYTDLGVAFEGTENHRIVQNGVKTEVGSAKSIDVSPTPYGFVEPSGATANILSTESRGVQTVWDITVDAPEHTFWCGGLLVSNCGEIGLDPRFAGRTGWAFCNLSEINGATCQDEFEFDRRIAAATILGTMQAAYTKFPYLDETSVNIARRDALLGVSINGMMDNPDICLNPRVLRHGAAFAASINQTFAKSLGIAPAQRITAIKPSGTSSLAAGVISPGIHAALVKPRGIRRVQANALEPQFQFFKSVNPHACYRIASGDWFIEFPVKTADNARAAQDMSAIEFLEAVRMTQENWVLPGTRGDTSPGLTHNVSNTCNTHPHEIPDVVDFVYKHRATFSGLTFFPHTGDVIYANAPWQKVNTPELETKWAELRAGFKPVDWVNMREDDDNTKLNAEAACVNGACGL